MAHLSKTQLLKRNNWDIFLNKIENREYFTLVNGSKIKLGYKSTVANSKFVKFLRSSGLEKSLESLKNGNKIVFPSGSDTVALSEILKSSEFGGKPGSKQLLERQEHSFVSIINNETSSCPVTINANLKIENVTNAYKYSGRNSLGKEPYTDVVLNTVNGACYNISMKGVTSPSIAGGGLAGINVIAPGFMNEPLQCAIEYFKNKGYKQGHEFSKNDPADVFYKIPVSVATKIVKGTKEMGGPIDYLYIGPMDVKYSVTDNVITFNGKFLTVSDLINSEELYIRIRRRSNDQTLTYIDVDTFGYPSLFTSQSEPNRRIEVYKKSQMPRNATIINKGLQCD
ncbi:hypothetical protein RVBP17_1390 [Pseudomonas phage sp. 30-3]|nr:hypothetical protein GBBBJNDB_00070 [Pseudomonas phage Callisto]WPK39223.1 hypothetical protein Deiofobo_0026 [Pseudomonas phage Deifobo]WPK40256.1 hypothetical protein Paride_0026 [Pseudomonas phage Paride]VOH53884.1 hypothetical protein MIJ3_00070 [Pseudomonas phage vB_PaeM_MIJ3]BDR25818.1 hypothetical protein RVBP16_2580 [Pseudomonas phage sp. 30-2]BDR26096.1 hypothetical protein RVBP17_1390 [Pseudomonas phage sp. 30-3]